MPLTGATQRVNAATRARSLVMRVLASHRVLTLQQLHRRLRRRVSGAVPTVHYFHELTDPFSHLAIQRLPALATCYRVRFIPHLVTGASAAWRGDMERFDAWALRDAHSVAVCFGVEPPPVGTPDSGRARHYQARLGAALAAAQADAPAALATFAEQALAVGRDYWSGIPVPDTTSTDITALVAAGDALRRHLGHYQGAMFYFEGEWYWGLDRVELLERRLITEGFARSPGAALVAPRPATVVPPGLNASAVQLEVFLSLRSPYTAAGFPVLEQLIAATGVRVHWRPVMPMMMRGVAAPRAKQQYIISDAAREARAAGVPFRNFVDPFGEPVRRALSLWAWVQEEGREQAFLASYLAAAWAEGIDITQDSGLAQVLSRAGLDPAAMTRYRDDPRSTAELDQNLTALLEAGLWGVPSFRVSSHNNDSLPFICWGQDRLWRLRAEIVRRSGGDPGIPLPETA